ncbi:MAG TPA: TIGR00159 family protein [Bacteroidales bacterium]|nr:MAG: TIGR00159 family protein [Bacteroidetes bacterium GWF2_33_38]OFY88907.1 MAG: TIGR00159 family protein [Bacteroidetes bacterium RIFOXYA2_FULL_33_7]HBF87629.1 TIGR00159 family protein [Bacteroidales bacterium]
MTSLFITLRFLDILDILLVAFILYKVYMLIRDTVAINIFIGVFSVYLLWLLVKAFNMQLLTTILNQVIGVGAIALIIVFQQEIRRFLLLLGTRYFSKNKTFSFGGLFSFGLNTKTHLNVKSIVIACRNLSKSKTGALIVISRKFDLSTFSNIGDTLNANLSSRLLETIFYKDTPLHDGAVIIVNNKVMAARCVLPISESSNLPLNLGMRHRAALGMSENSNATIIIVSEQTGNISYAKDGELFQNISPDDLGEFLEKEYN